MSVLGYDAVAPEHIPVNAAAIFPYADGEWAWSHVRFPRSRYRYITVRGTPGADVADFEPGAIWPGENLRRWADARLQAKGKNADLTVYTDRVNYPAVVSAMAGLSWHLFLATLDGSKPQSYLGRQCRAVQYADKGIYDMSVVWDESWLNQP